MPREIYFVALAVAMVSGVCSAATQSVLAFVILIFSILVIAIGLFTGHLPLADPPPEKGVLQDKLRDFVRYNLHALGCFSVFVVAFGLGVAIAGWVVGTTDDIWFYIILVVALVGGYFLARVYRKSFRLRCPDCQNRLELQADYSEGPFLTYVCPGCDFKYETAVPFTSVDLD